jgi:hypothetical protein
MAAAATRPRWDETWSAARLVRVGSTLRAIVFAKSPPAYTLFLHAGVALMG